MKYLFGIIIIMGSLCGMAISFFSDIVVKSSLPIFDGLKPSMAFGLFFIVVFIGGVQILFSSN